MKSNNRPDTGLVNEVSNATCTKTCCCEGAGWA